MFKGLFGKKEKNNKLYAPLKGEAVLLENIEDPMFAQKILGDGIAIEHLKERYTARQTEQYP